ncbi:hypothetical protein HZS_1052 [Henneguya salminicola]|nr:hypothetical protein HZS_1052 [Henneguya salminicola]
MRKKTQTGRGKTWQAKGENPIPTKNSRSHQLIKLFKANPRSLYRILTEKEPSAGHKFDCNTIKEAYSAICHSNSCEIPYKIGEHQSRFPQLFNPFTDNDLVRKLNAMNACSSAGPDDIHLSAIKWLFEGKKIELLTSLFNIFLSSNYIPPCFKEAHTILIPKNADAPDT